MAIDTDTIRKEFMGKEIPVLDWYFAKDIEEQYNSNRWRGWKDEYIPIASDITGDAIFIYNDALYSFTHDDPDAEPYLISEDIPLVLDILKKLKEYKKSDESDSLSSLEEKQDFINNLIDKSPEDIQDMLEQELYDIEDLIEEAEDEIDDDDLEVKIEKKPSTTPTSTKALSILGIDIKGFEEIIGAKYASCELLASGSLEAQKKQKEWVEKGYPLEIRHRETGMLFRLVPSGSFMMGTSREFAESNKSKVMDFKNEMPQHKVIISYPLYVGKYPVTQREYVALMKKNPSKFKKEGLDNPVENISHDSAKAFATKMDSNVDATIRLLSESEWEYACRAGTETAYYFGDEITIDLANYDPNYVYKDGFWVNQQKGVYRKKSTPVGIFPPNAYGIYDMHGNVDERVEDIYHDNYIGVPTDGSAWIEGKDTHAVYRGGSWNDNYPWDLRSASRGVTFIEYDSKYHYLGFRIALDLRGLLPIL